MGEVTSGVAVVIRKHKSLSLGKHPKRKVCCFDMEIYFYWKSRWRKLRNVYRSHDAVFDERSRQTLMEYLNVI